MMNVRERHHRPRLLVSVRSASEALAALAGGADVIDIKEPDRGSLGAADSSTIAAVVRAVNGRAPVTAAAGELVDLVRSDRGQLPKTIPSGVSLFKIGLAGCGDRADWMARWGDTITALANRDLRSAPQAVAVAYADWRAANAPAPDDVLDAADKFGCHALLVDTWNKSAGSLFDQWSSEKTGKFVRTAQSHRLVVVLAGSLADESLVEAVRLGPDLVAVRSAACDAGRRGTISSQRVFALRQAIDAVWETRPAPT